MVEETVQNQHTYIHMHMHTKSNAAYKQAHKTTLARKLEMVWMLVEKVIINNNFFLILCHRYSKILVKNNQFYQSHLHLAPIIGATCSGTGNIGIIELTKKVTSLLSLM